MKLGLYLIGAAAALQITAAALRLFVLLAY